MHAGINEKYTAVTRAIDSRPHAKSALILIEAIKTVANFLYRQQIKWTFQR